MMTDYDRGMIELSTAPPLGRGTERVCYEDPRDPRRVIKVDHNRPKKKRRWQSLQDARYLSHLARRGVPFDHLTRYFGKVETDLGTGWVFERVTNDDGSAPESLEDLLAEGDREMPASELLELRDAMLEHGVVPCDLRLDNVLLPVTGGRRRAVLVDGVRNSDFVPIATYSRWFARKKIARKWEKFLRVYVGMSLEELRHLRRTISRATPPTPPSLSQRALPIAASASPAGVRDETPTCPAPSPRAS